MPNFKKRCSYCINLIEDGKKWYCAKEDEPCEQIVWCKYFRGIY